jgi:multicomponent Na+:H+ antiporter subunit B
MKGVWTSVQGADPEPIALGTPFLFDIGVYFLVIGIVLTIVLELGEDEE